jgi:hypothetical protein
MTKKQSPLSDSSGRVASRRKRRLKTPPVREASQKVLVAFNTGCGSSMLIGKARLGKTFAARWICQCIEMLLGPVSWFEISFEKSIRPSESNFFSLLLKSVDHQYVSGRRPRELRDRISEFLIERASESPLGTVILLLDEAQNLSEIHWTWLAELSNSIDRAGFSLFTLSTGQPSLYAVRNTLRELTSSDHESDFIIGRFFLDMNDFRGLQTKEDVRLTFREYGESPLGPGEAVLWIEEALPIAYKEGWRLEELTDVMWGAFCEVWRQRGRADKIEIPMTYFDLLVRQILTTPKLFNVATPIITQGQAIELVKRSQFAKAI